MNNLNNSYFELFLLATIFRNQYFKHYLFHFTFYLFEAYLFPLLANLFHLCAFAGGRYACSIYLPTVTPGKVLWRRKINYFSWPSVRVA